MTGMSDSTRNSDKMFVKDTPVTTGEKSGIKRIGETFQSLPTGRRVKEL